MTKLLCLCNNLERNTKSRQLINTLLIVSSENICMIEPARTNRRKLMCKNPAATCARTQGDRTVPVLERMCCTGRRLGEQLCGQEGKPSGACGPRLGSLLELRMVLRTVDTHDHTSGEGQPAMLDTMVSHKADKEISRQPKFSILKNS